MGTTPYYGIEADLMSIQELIARKNELAARLGPRLRPDGFSEFSQLIESADEVRCTEPDKAERLRRCAEKMHPRVERAVEVALSLREQIRQKLLEFGGEAMDRYDEALRELAK
jgi:hypothetical protein